jgi:hypothetical protein
LSGLNGHIERTSKKRLGWDDDNNMMIMIIQGNNYHFTFL